MAEFLQSQLLDKVPHAFSLKDGLAADDVLPGGVMTMVEQIHSAKVAVVRSAADAGGKADAMVTDAGGLVLGIVTADCAPVLLADVQVGVAGAAHAGWRGAHAGVLENTLDAMEALGAERSRVVAAIGPAIAQASYEVDERFRAEFREQDARFFAAGREVHWQFDLPAYVSARLARAGVAAIDDLGLDTYAHPARFHSYRRATHRGEATGGRQISAIAVG